MEGKDPNPPGSGPTANPGDQTTQDGFPTPVPGGLAARYDILGELGRGGMGIVYKARDRETGSLVALKVLRPEIAAHAQMMERFKNEVLLARKVTHRNVCRIHEFNRTDGAAYISMEFVDGESLRTVLNRFETISIGKGIKIASQICAGLREAHREGVIHRDLKPENVMLDRAGQVKLMDFGIARSIETDPRTSGAIVGTPAYMAPEQAEGKAVDQRADIYALGLILYEMFTGSPAFTGDTPVNLILKQIRETPRPPRELDPRLPASMEQAILRCLPKKPSERFQSVDALEAALLGALTDVRGEAPTPALEDVGPPALRRRRRPVVWIAAVVAALAGAILVTLWFFPLRPWATRPPQEAAKPAELPLVEHEPVGTQVKDWLARGDKFLESGEYSAAIMSYEAAVSLDPKNKVARSALTRARDTMAAEWEILHRSKKSK